MLGGTGRPWARVLVYWTVFVALAALLVSTGMIAPIRWGETGHAPVSLTAIVVLLGALIAWLGSMGRRWG